MLMMRSCRLTMMCTVSFAGSMSTSTTTTLYSTLSINTMPTRKDRQANVPSAGAHQNAFGGGMQADESVEQQLWHEVRAQLRILEQLRPATERTLRELDRLQAQMGSTPTQSTKDAAKEKGLDPDLVGAEDRYKDNERILKLCEEVHATEEAEEGAIDAAVEQLSILIALTSAPPDHPDSKRKKRRTEASPPRGSMSPLLRGAALPGADGSSSVPFGNAAHDGGAGVPLSSRSATSTTTSTQGSAVEAGAALPAVVTGGTGRAAASGSQGETKRKANVKSRRTTASSSGTSHDPRGSSPIAGFYSPSAGPAAGHSVAGGGGTSGAAAAAAMAALGSGSSGSGSALVGGNEREYIDPARARREVLAHQLPLRKGRKVAFRQPTKRNPGPGGQQPIVTENEDGETWIMATVEECINNDRNRYVVRDLEDEGQTVAATWNTTLKAIVPLPESVPTLPPHDYAPGSQVMALYPDTTCFYKATIVSGGPGVHKLTPAKASKKENELLNAPYKLIFEDDGDDIKTVAAFLVVERP
ncbi:hypothetical protein V8E36_009076 [Tilletia maclaganii]